jgi:hypothetical protein
VDMSAYMDVTALQSISVMTTVRGKVASVLNEVPCHEDVRECIQKFPDWPPGAKTTNSTTLCH